MVRTSAQNEALRAASQARIEAAAIHLFAAKGFAATTMRDVAAAAGVSTGLVYRHHATKEELFAHLVDRAADGLRRLASRFRDGADPGEVLAAFTGEVLAGIAGDAEFVTFLLLMNQAFAMPDPPPALAEQHAAVMRATAALVAEGQRAGRFRAGPAAELTTCYFATLSGLALMKHALGDRLRVPSVATVLAVLVEEAP